MSSAGVLEARMRLSAYREGRRGVQLQIVDVQLDDASGRGGFKHSADDGVCGDQRHPKSESHDRSFVVRVNERFHLSRQAEAGAPIGLRAALLAWAVLAAVAPPAFAKDLGVRGETWPIAEPDLLEQIETRLAVLELSGETARFEREAIARARAHVEAPPRVAGVVPATESRSWLFDPSIVIERDIATPDGTVIAAAGTRVNPLLARPLTRDVLFVDGARSVEVAWALAHPRPARIVLVGGRPLALSRAHGRSFFFDQGGALTARLGIATTPARAFQEGAALRIEETPVEDRAPFEAVGRASASAPAETGR